MTLTAIPADPYLDLPAHRGQFVARFQFQWINGTTGQHLGYVFPSRATPPTLSHDTTRTVKRQLDITLGVEDTAAINPITDRILPWVLINGTMWPLGRFMFSDETDLQTTRGDNGSFTLLDEGFIVDQQMENAFTSSKTVDAAIRDLLRGVPLPGVIIAATTFRATGAFPAGNTRGQTLDAYATQGDFFPYWMNHDGILRMIRTIDPSTAVVDFDFDTNKKVIRGSITKTSDILTAPNRFVVVSNGGTSSQAALTGSYDVPATAPHSIANRGFVIPKIYDIQLSTTDQASAVARNLGIRETIFERVTLATSIDPRHDSYNVIRFDGVNWLELGWSMSLTTGGQMQHTMRKAYS